LSREPVKALSLGVIALLLSLIFASISVDVLYGQCVCKFSDRGGIPGRPPWAGPPSKAEELTVSIAYPENGSILEIGTHAIDVKATGEEVTVKVDINGSVTDITDTKSGDYYVYYPWVVEESGTYVITAEATDAYGNTATTSITVNVVSDVEAVVTVTHELFIEIDYIREPTAEVIEYIKSYYYARGVYVVVYVDDSVTDPTPETAITDGDFWAIEEMYNDIMVYNDRAQDGIDADGDGSDAEYTLKEKWVLFGTSVEGQKGVVGYCYVKIENKDLVAGNYIFIADETADNWSIDNGIEPYGAEAVVLMHELGHSIGIGKVRVRGRFVSEIYDEDPFSVMSYLTTDNAGLYWAWHYSNEYWATRDMGYYAKE